MHETSHAQSAARHTHDWTSYPEIAWCQHATAIRILTQGSLYRGRQRKQGPDGLSPLPIKSHESSSMLLTMADDALKKREESA